MGQKVNPIGLRLILNKKWQSKWFANRRDFGNYLLEDIKIREYVKGKLKNCAVARVQIERPAKKVQVTIYSARPGLIIGKKGSDIEKLKKKISEFTSDEVSINLVEIRKPEVEAQLIADTIAEQLERRVSFRRAMKRSVQSAMRLGADGIRVNCGGRLGGTEIARTDWYREGRVPLHTFRANIDYAESTAATTYGACGIKVWIYKGDIDDNAPHESDKNQNKLG
jgi:small subunit ribosomal protein S3